MNKRDVTFDLMKGLGILLMMVCHMPDIPKGVHQFVYSFHMPLFFIISGYFTKKRDRIDENYVSDLLKKLVLPFIIVQFALVLWGGVMSIAKHDMNFLYRYFCEFVWTSALPWHTNYGDIYTGAVWFLLAMFWAKLFFSYLLSKSKHYFLICFIISTIVNVTCIYCRQILYLPTFIIQGAGAVQLLAVGYWFKQNELPGWTVFVGAIAWLLAMVFGGIDLYVCYYKLYPVSIFGAIGGVYVLYLLSRNVVNMLKNICPPLLLKFVKWCGENSLVILCVHHFERWSCMSWTIMAHLPFGFEGWIMSVFRILLTLVLSYLFVLSKCKIEQMRKDRQMS